jgi:hypothetical protein
MSSKKAVFQISIVISIFLLYLSCTSVKADSSWVDSEYGNGPVKKIVVLGLFNNTTNRRIFETEVTNLINAKTGTEAISSLDIMPPNIVYDYNNMEGRFREMGIDGILILRTKTINTQTTYIPGSTYTVRTEYPMYYYQYPYYYKYYRHTYETIREPGYFKDSFIVCTESTLFINSDDEIIWMIEKNTTQQYRTIDGITDPKAEAVRLARLILYNLNSSDLLLDD